MRNISEQFHVAKNWTQTYKLINKPTALPINLHRHKIPRKRIMCKQRNDLIDRYCVYPEMTSFTQTGHCDYLFHLVRHVMIKVKADIKTGVFSFDVGVVNEGKHFES